MRPFGRKPIRDLSACTLILLTACGAPESEDSASDASVLEDPAVEIVSQGLSFQMPEEVEAGWNTFRFRNESGMVHFAAIERVPDGVGLEAHQTEVAPVFQEGMDQLAAGEVDAAMATFGELPEWFGEVVFLGGPGLTAPGRVSEVTVFLEPGEYLLECWVKTDGTFHSYNPDPDLYGMVQPFTVVADSSGMTEPTPDLTLTLSSTEGIEIDGELRTGPQTVAVHFADQTVHENFLGHDIHLARIDENTDLDALSAWMDWSRPGGLQTPAPVEFVGGLSEMPAEATGYIHLDLEPGRYAWVAEVTDPAEKGLLLTFEVPAEDEPEM